MHFETYNTHPHTTTPNRPQSLEKAKLGTRLDHDDDHMSQISTLHSLGNLDDHSTPEKTPTSGTMRDLLASAEHQLEELRDTLSRESSILKDNIERKGSELKGKVTEKFGAKVQPEKDLDTEVKEQIKEVNEEIKQLPHGEEEVVEAHGKAVSKKENLWKVSGEGLVKDLSRESSIWKDEVERKASELKGKVIEKFGAKVQPEKDLDAEVKEQVKEVNEEIKHIPHGEEQVVEGQGKAVSKKDKISKRAKNVRRKYSEQVTATEKKLDQLKDSVSKESFALRESVQEKTRGLKGKMTQKFGAKVQPEKDLDAEVKEQIKEVNEEIKHIPHGEEEVVEGQGKAVSKKEKISKKAKNVRRKYSEQVTATEKKLDQLKDSVSKESSALRESLQQKASGLKGKMTQKFGAKVQPEKDLDSEVKEQIKEVNEEIKHIPHGEEEIVEGQGKAVSKKEKISNKTKNVRRKMSAPIEDLKGKSLGLLKNGYVMVYEAKNKVQKELIQPIVAQVEEAPKKAVEETEVTRKPSGSGLEDLKSISKDILSKALGKIDEMRYKADHSIKLVKDQMHDISSKSSEKSPELHSQSAPSVDQLIDNAKGLISILDEALDKVEQIKITNRKQREVEASENRGEIFTITRQINEILEELKSTDQVPYEKMTTSAQQQYEANLQRHYLSKESPSFQPTKESHTLMEHELNLDHHHLSTQSQSFKPTKKGHILVEKVTEGRLPLSKIVEEVDHKKQKRLRAKTVESKPLEEKCYMLMDNVGGGMEELAPLIDEVEGVEDQVQVQEQEQEQVEMSSQLHEISQQGLDKIHQCIEDAFGRLAEQAENARRRLEALVDEDSSEKEEKIGKSESGSGSESESQGESGMERIKENIQDVSDKITEEVREAKESARENEDSQQGLVEEEEVHERQPLIDKIMNKIHAVNENIHQRVENVKQAFKVEDRAHEHEPLIDRISGKINNIASKIPHHKESMGNQAQPSYEIAEDYQDQEEDVMPFSESEYYALEDNKPSLRKRVVGNLKGMFASRKEEVEEEQEIEEKEEEQCDVIPVGIAETMFELKEAELVQPLLNKQSSEPVAISEEKPVEEPEEVRIDIDEEEESDDVEAEKEEVTEEVEEQDTVEQLLESVQEEDHSLRERISESLHNMSAKIHDNVESLKGKFRREKKQVEQDAEVVEEPVESSSEEEEEEEEEQEEAQPVEESKPSLRERISNKISKKVGNLKNLFKSGKEQEDDEDEDELEDDEQKEEEFHVVKDGIVETVDELKEEEHIEPLLSNNPFEPLATKDVQVVQPLEGGEIVGGNLEKVTAKETIGFKEEEMNDEDSDEEEVHERKSMFQRIMDGFLSGLTHKKE